MQLDEKTYLQILVYGEIFLIFFIIYNSNGFC